MKTRLSIKNIAVSYDSPLITNLSLSLDQGEIGCLLGASGSGKSTLLRAIAGLHKIDSGTIYLDHKLMADGKTSVEVEKRNIGLVFQDYALFPHMSVLKNIEFGATAAVDDLVELVGLGDFQQRLPHELSGGQQQRVALARALAMRPTLLLMDEPFSNLDANLRDELSEQTREIIRASNATALIVSHDQHEAFALADKIGVMEQGELLQWSSGKELIDKPSSIEITNFIGHAIVCDATVTAGTLYSSIGNLEVDYADGNYWFVIRPSDICHHLPPTLSVEISEVRYTPDGVRLRLCTDGRTFNFDLPTVNNHEKLQFALRTRPRLITKQ